MDFFTRRDPDAPAQTIAVRDPARVLLQLAIAGVFGFAAYTIGISSAAQNWPPLLVCGAVAVVFVLAARASWEGIVVDETAGTVELPGGGISANSVLEMLGPAYWLQIVRRLKLPLQQINHIRRMTTTAKQKGGQRMKHHYVSVQGSFGSVRVHFFSEGKRDQAFALLREVCHAGSPYSRS